MRVADEDEVGIAVSEEDSQFVVGRPGLDAWAIVGTKRRVDAEQPRAIGQRQALVDRQGREPVDPAGRRESALGPGEPLYGDLRQH